MSINTLDKNTPLAPPQSMSVVCKPDWLENQYYQIQVAKNGTLKILDKQTGVTYQNMGQLSIRGEQGDSYNGAPNPKVPIKYPTLSKTTLNHQGPLVGNLTLYHQLDGQTYQTTITLNANDAMVYFDTQFINTLKDVCVHVGFETETPIQTVLAETHFGTINRHYNPHYNITQAMPAPAQTELKTNTGPIQRFITANNHYIVTEGLTEYEVEKKQLKLTLLRTFEQISSPDTGVRGTQAGPPFTTPEGQCLNRSMAFRYGWCPDPHDTSTQFNLANQFYGSIVAFDSDLLKPESKAPSKKSESTIISNQALFFWKNPAIQKSACYPIKDGYILRLFNTQNTHQSLALNFQVPPASVTEVTMLETPISPVNLEQLTLSPHQVLTLKIMP